MADPATPASIRAVMRGAAWRTTAKVLPAPVNPVAPTSWASTPTCSARITPNGTETASAGSVHTRIVNQVWRTYSSRGNRRWATVRTVPTRTSSASRATPRISRTRERSVSRRADVACVMRAPVGE